MDYPFHISKEDFLRILPPELYNAKYQAESQYEMYIKNAEEYQITLMNHPVAYTAVVGIFLNALYKAEKLGLIEQAMNV